MDDKDESVRLFKAHSARMAEQGNPWWSTLGFTAVVVAGWAYLLFMPIPQLPIDSANGEFANDCCGTIRLKNGQMSVAKQIVSYVIEADKGGPYVLTKGYVGVGDAGMEINQKAFPLKMYLDKATNPTSIDISGRSASFRFDRVALSGA